MDTVKKSSSFIPFSPLSQQGQKHMPTKFIPVRKIATRRENGRKNKCNLRTFLTQ